VIQEPHCLPPTCVCRSDETSRTLTRHDIQVRCVLLSKEAQMFEGRLGAAFFRTDIGDFDAQFLPSSQSWDKLKVIEQHELGGYTKHRFFKVLRHVLGLGRESPSISLNTAISSFTRLTSGWLRNYARLCSKNSSLDCRKIPIALTSK
jgi:hypothetical protein